MKRLAAPVGFAALVAAVVLAPFVFSHYRTFQLGFVAVYLVALLGLNMLTGFTGQISLGHGAFMGIGAYTTTILVVDHGWRDLLDDPGRRCHRRRVRPRVRPAGDAVRRPVPRARDVRDPALVHRDPEALPALHGRQRRQEPSRSSTRSSGSTRTRRSGSTASRG